MPTIQVIRPSVFETNSSSCHSLVIIDKNAGYGTLYPNDNGVLTVNGGEFGRCWSPAAKSIEERVSYLLTASHMGDSEPEIPLSPYAIAANTLWNEVIEVIKSHTGAKEVKLEYTKTRNKYGWDDYSLYCDHGNEHVFKMLEEVMEKEWTAEVDEDGEISSYQYISHSKFTEDPSWWVRNREEIRSMLKEIMFNHTGIVYMGSDEISQPIGYKDELYKIQGGKKLFLNGKFIEYLSPGMDWSEEYNNTNIGRRLVLACEESRLIPVESKYDRPYTFKQSNKDQTRYDFIVNGKYINRDYYSKEQIPLEGALQFVKVNYEVVYDREEREENDRKNYDKNVVSMRRKNPRWKITYKVTE